MEHILHLLQVKNNESNQYTEKCLREKIQLGTKQLEIPFQKRLHHRFGRY